MTDLRNILQAIYDKHGYLDPPLVEKVARSPEPTDPQRAGPKLPGNESPDAPATPA